VGLIFVVARTEPKYYSYLKHLYGAEGMDVVLDRRTGERRQRRMTPPVEMRHIERRRHPDTTTELRSAGWIVVRRPVK